MIYALSGVGSPYSRRGNLKVLPAMVKLRAWSLGSVVMKASAARSQAEDAEEREEVGGSWDGIDWEVLTVG